MTPFTMKLSEPDYAGHANGTAIRMIDMLILMACRHGANRLEFRTIAGEFRIAEIIDNQAFEFPSPPQSIRDTILDYLRLMCRTSSSSDSAENEVQIDNCVAKLHLRCESNHDAVVTIVSAFAPTPDYDRLFDSFWQTLPANTENYGCIRRILQKTVNCMNAWRTKR